MSIALYRKYRPKTFSEISGQNHIKVTLLNEISTDRLVHAYLFCGPRGTGKTTIARLLAKAANCLTVEPNGEPCNHCSNCEDILAGRSMDMIEIDAASHTGVDNVRENIIQNARFTPGKSKYKVFIIDEVHMLSTQAFNALLKTLEEAPKHVIFILATTEAHKVPATIISRCQRFDFKKVVFSEVVNRLKWIATQEEMMIDEQVLSLIAKQSGGCVRDAESLLEQIFSLGEKNITLAQAELILPSANFNLLFNFFERLLRKQTAEALALINQLVRDGVDTMLFLDDFVEFSRQILVYKISGQLEELSREVEENIIQGIVKLSPEISEQFLIAIIKSCFVNKELFKQSHLSQLALEMVAFDLTVSNEVVSFIKKVDLSGVVVQKPMVKPLVQVEQPLPEKQAPLENEKLSVNIPFDPADDGASAASAGAEALADKQGNNSIGANSFDPFEAKKTEPPSDQIVIAVEEPIVVPVVEVVENNSGDQTLSLAHVSNQWDKILSKMREKNYLLYMSLRMGKPVDINAGVLVIGFLFELQRQRIDKPEGRGILKDCLISVFGREIAVNTRIEPGLGLSDLIGENGVGRPRAATVETVADIAGQFGGTVVESL